MSPRTFEIDNASVLLEAMFSCNLCSLVVTIATCAASATHGSSSAADKTTTPVESRYSQDRKLRDACTLCFWREKAQKARTALCSAVLALRGTDAMSSKMTWPVPGHQRWDTLSMSAGCLAARKKQKKKRGGSWRCVKSVTVSVVSVSAQLVMEDVNVCRACDSLKYLSHLGIVDLCDFLEVIVKTCLLVRQLERVCIQSHVQTATLMHKCATDSTLEHVLGNTMRKSLLRSGLIRNKVVTLTVINRVVQRGTNIHDSGDTGEGAAPLAQALCTRRQVQVQHTLQAQARCIPRQ